MPKKLHKKSVNQKYLNLQTTNFKQADTERLLKTATPAATKKLIVNTYEYELKLIKRNQSFTKREIQGFENKLKKLKDMPNNRFKNDAFVKQNINYIVSKNKKNPLITSNNLRAKLISNDRFFTKSGKLRTRFNNIATSLSMGFTTQQAITIFLRHLKGWIRRGLITLTRTTTNNNLQMPIYIINILGYSGDNFLEMLETQFGIDIEMFFFDISRNRTYSYLTMKPHMTPLIDRYEASGWTEKVR